MAATEIKTVFISRPNDFFHLSSLSFSITYEAD